MKAGSRDPAHRSALAMPWSGWLVGSILSVTLSGCGREPAGDQRAEALRPACGQVCGSFLCDGVTEYDPAVINACVDNCAAHLVPAEDLSQDCAASYESLIMCLSTSDCASFLDWGMDPQTSTTCAAEAAGLDAACPDFVFSFTVAPMN